MKWLPEIVLLVLGPVKDALHKIHFGLLVLLKLWRREQQCLVLNLCLTRTWEALGFNEMEFLS